MHSADLLSSDQKYGTKQLAAISMRTVQPHCIRILDSPAKGVKFMHYTPGCTLVHTQWHVSDQFRLPEPQARRHTVVELMNYPLGCRLDAPTHCSGQEKAFYAATCAHTHRYSNPLPS